MGSIITYSIWWRWKYSNLNSCSKIIVEIQPINPAYINYAQFNKDSTVSNLWKLFLSKSRWIQDQKGWAWNDVLDVLYQICLHKANTFDIWANNILLPYITFLPSIHHNHLNLRKHHNSYIHYSRNVQIDRSSIYQL